MPLKASRSFSNRGGQWRSFINHDASLYLHLGNISPSSRFGTGFNQRCQRFWRSQPPLRSTTFQRHFPSRVMQHYCRSVILIDLMTNKFIHSLSIIIEASSQLASHSLASSLLPKTLCGFFYNGTRSPFATFRACLQIVGEVQHVHRSGGMPDVINAAPVGLCVAQSANLPQRQGQSRPHVVKTWVPP